MAFRVKHGDLDAIVQLGALAGMAQKRERQEEQALRIALQTQQIQAQVRMARFRAKLSEESQKRQIAWELQKSQMSQQNTFQMQEELRMQRMQKEEEDRDRKEQEFEAANKAIDDAEHLTEPEKERMRVNVQLRHRMGPSAPQIPTPKVIDTMKMQRTVEDDLMYYQDIISSYAENKNLPGITRGTVPLARYDDTKKDWVEASDQERAIYDYAKTQASLRLNQLKLTSGGIPLAGVGGGGDFLGLLGPTEEMTTDIPRPVPSGVPEQETSARSLFDIQRENWGILGQTP